MTSGFSAFAAANGVGVFLYAYLTWRIVHIASLEQRPVGDFGDNFEFLFTTFPVLIAFILIDAVWLIVGCVRVWKYRDRHALVLGLAVVGAWAFALLALRQIL